MGHTDSPPDVIESFAVTDAAWLADALDLARQGPALNLNPQVGCVIIDPQGIQIASGFHRGSGTAHAEAAALASAAEQGIDLRGATAYVTLEPCNHMGRTGPCSAALIGAGITRVVYALPDQSPGAGGGADELRAAGVMTVQAPKSDLTKDLLKSAAELIAPWQANALEQRPWVTLKLATSLDGRIAANDGSSQWISGEGVRGDNHFRRSQHDVIAVGTGTVLRDNPSLTAREPDGSLSAVQPRPLVIGTREIPADARLHVHPLPILRIPGIDLNKELRELYLLGVKSIYLEGGTQVASSFSRAGLVDEYLVYVAPLLLGGKNTWQRDLGIESLPEGIKLGFLEVKQLGADVLLRARPIKPDAEPGEITREAVESASVLAVTTQPTR